MDVQERLQATLTGRYDIEREIGRGGMATVYLARDVRHERAVALKVLDPELGAVLGAERFLTEIKTTANLQHPNLLPLFDSGEADGLLFYVMPYVEGESLRARLDREKQFSVDEAIHIGVAILNALHYAHEHGVIHRDLKPENILLQAGQPVIADFGIALAVSKAGGARITQTGLSLGTPQYMSPEQATGDRTIDGRTDIYSLAAMAYEMLTGEPPHLGGTSQAIIAKLMTERPSPVTNLRPNVPPHVNAAIMHALEKLPADRFATARDFATALSTPGTMPATNAYVLAQAASARSRASRFVVPALAAAAVLSLGLASWALMRPAPVSRVTRVEVAIPDSMAPLPFSTFALSPDGNSVVYAGPSANGARLWLKARDRARPTLLAAVNAVNPTFTFSPDGQWVAYTAGGRLAKTPTVGGASITVADTASTTRGVAWLADNTLVFVRDGGLGLKRVSAAGGAVTMLMKSDSGVLAVPTALPRSRGVLFTRCIGANCVRALDLWVLDLKSGQSERLVQGAVRGWYAPSGHLLYVRPDGAMLAAPFDLSSLKLTGDAVPVLDSVSVFNGVPMFALSDEGTVVMRSGASVSVQPTHTLVWVDRTGRESVVDTAWTFRATVSGGNVGWSLSPDGRRVAIGLNTGAGDDIWIKQLPNGPLGAAQRPSARRVE